MGRKPRVEYAGALYHVIQRGNNREYIFDKDEDKTFLLKDIKDRKVGTGFKLYGYVIMDNHYHLVLQVEDEPLSKLMHLINSSYGRYYNREHNRTGHVYDGRYKVIPIQNERYLMAVLRYVHRNPVRAGICSQVNKYSWSSDEYYRNNRGNFIDIDLLLGMLSNDREKAIKQYISFMEQEDTIDYEQMDVIGDRSFMITINPPKKEPVKKSLDEILVDTGVCPADFTLIKNGSRKRNLVPYKVAYAEEAVKQKYTFKSIGENINVSATAISKLLNGVE
ncbi:REP element-mobilizing transposase RayT [Desulfotomaculum arcticum]|uniref:REP element-mobilizing transposase RayT n=1 Tax=Desulfotruncus arcticus DSM 17038 TaxID=1121424 RepID=A0A1I2MN59_9FIRM|nr:transposase [Desulfotruncus arcticus]SFF92873.1 REP element-mobilizing transposase RayT [Desulfotomaculum arcticum] [Desulfotruncus arcticus DSM 17038]